MRHTERCGKRRATNSRQKTARWPTRTALASPRKLSQAGSSPTWRNRSRGRHRHRAAHRHRATRLHIPTLFRRLSLPDEIHRSRHRVHDRRRIGRTLGQFPQKCSSVHLCHESNSRFAPTLVCQYRELLQPRPGSASQFSPERMRFAASGTIRQEQSFRAPTNPTVRLTASISWSSRPTRQGRNARPQTHPVRRK